MIDTLGSLSLGGALMVAIVGVVASIVAARTGRTRPLGVARWSLGGMAILFTVAAGALVAAFLKDQFQFEYVRGYSEQALPFGYKLAAFWAGQEGSLLLWAWMLAVMCAIAVFGHRKQTGPDHAIAVGVMTLVCGFFAVLLVFATSPFALVEGAVPADGHGLIGVSWKAAIVALGEDLDLVTIGGDQIDPTVSIYVACVQARMVEMDLDLASRDERTGSRWHVVVGPTTDFESRYDFALRC